MRKWPRFEIANFPTPTGIPNEWVKELIGKGVPKSLFELYHAAGELTLLDDPASGPLVCFGDYALYGRICLNPRTEQIVDIIYVPVETPNMPAGVLRSAMLVNSSLDQFTASVRSVLSRFPFDTGDTGDDTDEDSYLDRLEAETDRAVQDMAATLRRIDEAALLVDGFWTTFLDDVQMGDFSTKDILGGSGASHLR